MFVDLMSDLYHTFAERFLRAQIVFEPQQGGDGAGGGPGARRAPQPPSAPTKRYNALGILEDVPADEDGRGNGANGGEPEGEVDIAPDEAPRQQVVARKEARVVGAGRGVTSLSPGASANTDWSSVGRNDPCPCGSGKKFKKCHGATV